jgi:hypothetical protein
MNFIRREEGFTLIQVVVHMVMVMMVHLDFRSSLVMVVLC